MEYASNLVWFSVSAAVGMWCDVCVVRHDNMYRPCEEKLCLNKGPAEHVAMPLRFVSFRINACDTTTFVCSPWYCGMYVIVLETNRDYMSHHSHLRSLPLQHYFALSNTSICRSLINLEASGILGGEDFVIAVPVLVVQIHEKYKYIG